MVFMEWPSQRERLPEFQIRCIRPFFPPFDIKEENIPWVREHGIKFSLTLAVKKPGIYYVRTAVWDPMSGKMGSAYQYIEIPDLKKNRLALSNIFIINRAEDLPWVGSNAPEEFGTIIVRSFASEAELGCARGDCSWEVGTG
jgi:hypothetical protein